MKKHVKAIIFMILANLSLLYSGKFWNFICYLILFLSTYIFFLKLSATEKVNIFFRKYINLIGVICVILIYQSVRMHYYIITNVLMSFGLALISNDKSWTVDK